MLICIHLLPVSVHMQMDNRYLHEVHDILVFIVYFLIQGLTVYPRLALNSRSSCLSLLSAGIIGVNHQS
jgi:hypothetical protein